MRKVLSGITISLAVAMTVLVPAAPASASRPSLSSTPGAMPYVTSINATVRELAQCGSTMYAVGSFTKVAPAGGASITRDNAYAFNATTGAISSWNPKVNGRVNSVAFAADCSSVYLGGSFSTVHGRAVSNLAKVNASVGAVDPAFHPAPDGEVSTVQQAGGRLYVGGSFRTIAGTARAALAAVNPTNGAIDPFVKLNVTGALPNSHRRVYDFALSHSGTRLLAMGSFLAVAGVDRRQVFMMDLGGRSATLDAWSSPDFSLTCAAFEPFYIRAAAWSPDDASIYLAATGFKGVSPLCDAASKFASDAKSNLRAIWIDRTGCDSLYSIAVDDTFVYVGGHQRWLGNPGCNAAGSGASPRSGIGSLFATTGAVSSWNPTRARGKGADDLLLTSAGLWIASDTFFNSVKCAGTYHPGICFFPR